jgi:hypothetical protein
LKGHSGGVINLTVYGLHNFGFHPSSSNRGRHSTAARGTPSSFKFGRGASMSHAPRHRSLARVLIPPLATPSL